MGAAVACAWVWMLAVVTAWLKLSPNCEDARLRKELSTVNREHAYVATESGPPALASSFAAQYALTLWPNLDDPNELRPLSNVPSSFPHPVHYPGPGQHSTSSIAPSMPSPARAVSPRNTTDSSDEYRSIPLFNYARAFSWSRVVNDVALAFESSAQPEGGDWALTMDGSIHEDNRRGNASEVLAYVDGVLLTSNPLGPCDLEPSAFRTCSQLKRLVHSLWVSGNGCIWSLRRVYYFRAVLPSDTFLFICFCYPFKVSQVLKIVAWINCVSFIILCLLRFAHQFDNCYCGCAVLGNGSKAFQVFVDPYPVDGFFRFWIASIVFSAAASVLLYLFTWANGN
ncbi:hypothetical protein BDZ89DRAFT_1060347 [Hymenopellis radicata]|nr:hypothetical protein BDZ89DRAFT_1060347 [Hymenopellis radicata]